MAGSGGLAGHIRGLREAKAAFNRLPQVFRERLTVAAEMTVREIARAAYARISASPSVRTGSLRDAIAWRISAKTGRGRVGITTKAVTVNGRLVNPARTAHLVEFGTVQMPAEPFMLPAADAQKGPYLQRCRQAGQLAERDLSVGRSL